MSIKIALLGLGRTGTVIAKNLLEDNRFDLVFAVKSKVKKSDKFDFVVGTKEQITELVDEFEPDVVIDFTTPDAVMHNIEQLKDGTSYIIATTGFRKNQLQKLEKYDHLKIMYAANISDGINVVIKLCEYINNTWKEADIEIIEQHFRGKKDLPSGTAIELARAFDQDVPIHSVRAGGTAGIHEVILATDNQKITIRHESFNREVFAEGAKRAALWLIDMPCGFYRSHDVYK